MLLMPKDSRTRDLYILGRKTRLILHGRLVPKTKNHTDSTLSGLNKFNSNVVSNGSFKYQGKVRGSNCDTKRKDFDSTFELYGLNHTFQLYGLNHI
jgi:hypothetical protein